MTNQEILNIINRGLGIDRTTAKAKDMVAHTSPEVLISTLSYLIGVLEAEPVVEEKCPISCLHSKDTFCACSCHLAHTAKYPCDCNTEERDNGHIVSCSLHKSEEKCKHGPAPRNARTCPLCNHKEGNGAIASTPKSEEKTHSALVSILMNHVGETGENEDAVEVLQRPLKEHHCPLASTRSECCEVKTPCCKQCEIYLGYKSQNEYQCSNGSCPCHSKREEKHAHQFTITLDGKAFCACGALLAPTPTSGNNRSSNSHSVIDMKENHPAIEG